MTYMFGLAGPRMIGIWKSSGYSTHMNYDTTTQENGPRIGKIGKIKLDDYRNVSLALCWL